MNEKVVSEKLCMPLCARVEKVISIPEHGVVAEVINYMGIELTFFHTGWMKGPNEPQRRFWYDVEAKEAFNEELPVEILKSIQNNEGFFLSRHNLCTTVDKMVYSIGEGEPVTGMSVEDACNILENWVLPGIRGTVMYGCIYDCLGQWLIEAGVLTEEEWVNSPSDIFSQKDIMFRDHGGWCLNELIGDIFSMELTQEKFKEDGVVTRGGVPFDYGEAIHPSRARYTYQKGVKHPDAKVRAFFYLKSD